MHQHTAGGNAKDVFAVDLKVVDTFFATKLLDRLDPNVAIEIPKRFPNAKLSGWHKVQAVGRIDRVIRSHPYTLQCRSVIFLATALSVL
jgi:hypothetical protein